MTDQHQAPTGGTAATGTADAEVALSELEPALAQNALAGVIESARRLGVELDEKEAAEWVSAMELESTGGGDLVVDVESGVYGHRVTMLDFSTADLEQFRTFGKIVGLDDRDNVKTALALSGSAAQSRIQRYPGDCDYFERVHITAPTQADAVTVLADVIREKALQTRQGPTYRLWEVKFGAYPWDAERGGAPVKKGWAITWSPDEVAAGQFEMVRDGAPITFTWDDAKADPGWCKLDWIVADPARRALANASNVLDVTWESPDGTITSLDGHVDPYFQEVYLETESLPVFTKIVQQLSADSVDEYVKALEWEVLKYTGIHGHEISYGKAARRMYNIFRLTGRYAEAAYLRELFDEPTTVLYQVAALIRTLDDADKPDSTFDMEMLVSQCDSLIMSAVSALDGPTEAEMVGHLLKVRDSLAKRAGGDRGEDVTGITSGALRAVNEYFERRLMDVPSIKAYIDELHAKAEATAS